MNNNSEHQLNKENYNIAKYMLVKIPSFLNLYIPE